MSSCLFTTLPSELILSITTHLPLTSTLRLRPTCSTLAKICNFPLDERRHRLYLHPKTISFAIDLLTSDTAWKEDISEVVVLGACDPGMKTRSEYHVLERRLDMKAWDQFPATETGRTSQEDEVGLEGSSFEENYRELLEGLRGLRKLEVLRYAGSGEELGMGFCGVSDEAILMHARARERYQLSFGGEGQPSLRQALKTTWWGDVDVFTAVLGAVGDVVERVEILSRMPAVEGFWSFRTAAPRCEAVKHVRVTVPGQRGWEEYLTKLLSSMEGIKDLGIDIKSELDEEQMRQWRNLSAAGKIILWEEEPSPAERFDFLEVARGLKLERLVVRGHTTYPYSQLDSDICWFLERHQESLKAVEMHNVLPFAADMVGLEGAGILPEYDMDEGTRYVVDFMKEQMHLEKAVLRIPRIGCVNGCDGIKHDAGCGVYPVKDTYDRVEVLDKFAKSRDVLLRHGWWDFAEGVVSNTANEEHMPSGDRRC